MAVYLARVCRDEVVLQDDDSSSELGSNKSRVRQANHRPWPRARHLEAEGFIARGVQPTIFAIVQHHCCSWIKL